MSLDFELSFAGLPFRPVLVPELEAKILKYANLKSLFNPPPDQREWQNVLPPAAAMPDLGLHELFYPWGARRFACMRGLMHKDDVAALLGKVTSFFPSSGYRATSATLKMQSGDPARPISTPMFLLPPEPLVGLNDVADLFLVTLVDERYWWRWSYLTVRSSLQTFSNSAQFNWDKTWDQLIQDCATATATTIVADPTDQKYGQPDASSPFFAFDQPVPPILDAAMAHTGRVLCREFDGTYKAVKYSAANANAEAMRIIASRELGGLAFTAAQYNEIVAVNEVPKVALSRPRQVRVVQGTWDIKAGKDAIRDVNIPQEDRTDFLDSTSGDSAGTVARKGSLFTEWRGQIRQHGTNPPANITVTLADDWYDWNARNLRETYSSIVAFNPEAGLDALYRYTNARTQVWCDPDNYEFVHFWHWDGTVINEWPRSAILGSALGTITDPLLTTANGNLVYNSDIGNVGREWPDIKINTTAGPGFGSPMFGPLLPGMAMHGAFALGTATSAYYLTDGILQTFGQPAGFPGEFIGHGHVYGGDQWLGSGWKHVGGIDLFSSIDGSPTPTRIYHGLRALPGSGPGGTIGLPPYGLPGVDPSTTGRGGVEVVGGFNSNNPNSAGRQAIFVQSIVYGHASSQSIVGNGIITSIGHGGPDGNDGQYGIGDGIGNFLAGGRVNFGDIGPIAEPFSHWIGAINGPAGKSMQTIGMIYSGGHRSTGGLGVAGAVYASGGFMANMNGYFATTPYGSGAPSGGGGQWCPGVSGYIPRQPSEQHGYINGQATPSYIETVGYPPDPSGPAMFIDGLYMGGGGGLASQQDLRDAMRVTQAYLSSLQTVVGTLFTIAASSGPSGTAYLATPIVGERIINGIVQQNIGTGLWSASTSARF